MTQQPEPLGKNTGVHCLWGWLDPRPGLDILGETKIWPRPGFEPQIVHTIAWWLKQLDFCVAPGKYWDGTRIRPWPYLLLSRYLQNPPVYCAVLCCTISQHNKIQEKKVHFIIVSFAQFSFTCIAYFLHQSLRRESQTGFTEGRCNYPTHIFIITELYIHWEQIKLFAVNLWLTIHRHLALWSRMCVWSFISTPPIPLHNAV